MVCACPSSVRLNEWSASSRAASDQSPQRLGVPNGLDHLAVLGEPRSGAPVQRWYFFGQPTAQLQPQEIPEQLVVAKPRPLRVQRYHKRVGVLEL